MRRTEKMRDRLCVFLMTEIGHKGFYPRKDFNEPIERSPWSREFPVEGPDEQGWKRDDKSGIGLVLNGIQFRFF